MPRVLEYCGAILFRNSEYSANRAIAQNPLDRGLGTVLACSEPQRVDQRIRCQARHWRLANLGYAHILGSVKTKHNRMGARNEGITSDGRRSAPRCRHPCHQRRERSYNEYTGMDRNQNNLLNLSTTSTICCSRRFFIQLTIPDPQTVAPWDSHSLFIWRIARFPPSHG